MVHREPAASETAVAHRKPVTSEAAAHGVTSEAAADGVTSEAAAHGVTSAAKATAAMSAPAAAMSAPATKRHSAGGRHRHAEGDSSCGRNQFPSHRSLSLFRIRPPSIEDVWLHCRANELQISHEENSLTLSKKMRHYIS
jgi:hypothetical protein